MQSYYIVFTLLSFLLFVFYLVLSIYFFVYEFRMFLLMRRYLDSKLYFYRTADRNWYSLIYTIVLSEKNVYYYKIALYMFLCFLFYYIILVYFYL